MTTDRKSDSYFLPVALYFSGQQKAKQHIADFRKELTTLL